MTRSRKGPFGNRSFPSVSVRFQTNRRRSEMDAPMNVMLVGGGKVPEGAGWWQEGCDLAVGAVKFQRGSEQQ